MPKSKSLTVKQRRFLSAKMDGKTSSQAAREAGYSESTARSANAVILPAVEAQFVRLLTKAGITDELLAKRLREGLDAEETKFAQHEGRITDERNVIAWGERRAYLELCCKLKGVKPADVVERTPLSVSVRFIEADLERRLIAGRERVNGKGDCNAS